MDIGSMSEFWNYLYTYFRNYIEEMQKREYEIPVQFIKIDLHIFKFNPLRGGTYVEFPKSIAATKGAVNIKNKDNVCFLYSILALKHRADVHPERVLKTVQTISQ